jgi:hypothetical protein
VLSSKKSTLSEQVDGAKHIPFFYSNYKKIRSSNEDGHFEKKYGILWRICLTKSLNSNSNSFII